MTKQKQQGRARQQQQSVCAGQGKKEEHEEVGVWPASYWLCALGCLPTAHRATVHVGGSPPHTPPTPAALTTTHTGSIKLGHTRVKQ